MRRESFGGSQISVVYLGEEWRLADVRRRSKLTTSGRRDGHDVVLLGDWWMIQWPA